MARSRERGGMMPRLSGRILSKRGNRFYFRSKGGGREPPSFPGAKSPGGKAKGAVACIWSTAPSASGIAAALPDVFVNFRLSG
jgi:hypothetical protein